MRFAIAPTQYFDDLGFNTKHWRKSLDGSQAICHAEFALTLGDSTKMETYEHNSTELQEILQGADWTEQVEEDVVEEFEKANKLTIDKSISTAPYDSGSNLM